MNGKQIIALLASSLGTGTLAHAGTPELQQKLDELKNKPEPRDLSPGAMCYRVASRDPQQQEQEYICPDCGKRTIYPKPDEAKQTETQYRELSETRRQLQNIKNYTDLLAKTIPQAAAHGYTLALNTTSFCSECGKGRPKQIMLTVLKPEMQTPQSYAITQNDLRMLDAFFAGKDRWKGAQGIEHPLKQKQSLSRIRELLSLPETPQP